MQFHSRDTLFGFACQQNPRWKAMGAEAFYKRDIEEVAKRARSSGELVAQHCMNCTELNWLDDSRPYYKVWPSIFPALLGLKMDVAPADFVIERSRPIAIRFPVGREPICGTVQILSLLIWSTMTRVLGLPEDQKHQVMMVFPDILSGNKRWRDGGFTFNLTDRDRTTEQILSTIAAPKEIMELDAEQAMFACAKIALTVSILAHDPSIIQPDVLGDDRNRFDRSTDEAERQRLVDKAARRGVVGWRVGEQYEVCPHYRRPHFALRHTGKKGLVPKIVPVRSCIVHRKKVTDVPTGYMTPEGEEVEV